ncbi:NDP-sugar synthase [Methanoplanus sp. FWC-SCC4]|uniref:Bifunctional protein GlmU n=1 Tax=Methanochimaera problematica TaxID=2609417 RepID=A0AA97I220_9EURY|nr:NDP-sugar synthase [Methanoplanus sp. FWC-SCC4]WOF15780.1 NDP-sugar synthase [Methanoplanus sp. FWC-SCC4]
MKVCIMCGGEGTRLRPLTFERPKPCIPIVNIPSIQHLVSHLSNLGFNDIIITIGYKGDDIQNALGDGSLLGVNITYVREEEKLGTAGSVKNAEQYLKESPFLVVGGDHITDIDLLSFYREHTKGESMVSIGLISIDDPCEYGIAEIDVNYHIKRFREKPSPGEIFSNLASTGIYVCNPEIFEYIPKGDKFDFAKDLFPMLMEKGIILKGWLARGNWTDVGSPQSLRQAEHWKLQDIHYTNISGNVTVKDAQVLGPVQLGDSITIGENSRVIGPVSIGSGTVIGENVLIGPYTSIGKHCSIEHDSKIFSSSIYNHVDIGASTTISGSIIDNDAKIGVFCNVENDTVIGPRTVLNNRTVVHSGTRIWPEVRIEEGKIVKEYVLNDDFETAHSGS